MLQFSSYWINNVPKKNRTQKSYNVKNIIEKIFSFPSICCNTFVRTMLVSVFTHGCTSLRERDHKSLFMMLGCVWSMWLWYLKYGCVTKSTKSFQKKQPRRKKLCHSPYHVEAYISLQHAYLHSHLTLQLSSQRPEWYIWKSCVGWGSLHSFCNVHKKTNCRKASTFYFHLLALNKNILYVILTFWNLFLIRRHEEPVSWSI